jgi:beta-glucosidase-like glycosyl hydrolase
VSAPLHPPTHPSRLSCRALPAVRPLLTAAVGVCFSNHLFMVQFRLGFADPPSMVPWSKLGEEVVNTPEHQALAKYAADSSIVLLKNDAKTLPLKHKAGMKIAVLGRNAAATTNMQGNYFGTAPFLISPCKGFEAFGSVTCVNGTGDKAKSAAVNAVKGALIC